MSSTLKKLPMIDGFDEMVVPEVLVENTRDLSHKDPRLKGIDFPCETQRDMDDFTKELWKQCIEVMIGRGIENTNQIASLTGLSRKYAGQFRNSVLKRWGDTMTSGTVNARREKLYYEAERVKSELWKMYDNGDKLGADFREQLSYLKMIVDTGARQAKLCGIDGGAALEVNVTQNKSKELMAQEVATNISAENLAAIGKLLASDMGKEGSS